MTLTEKLHSTKPETFSAIIQLANAYEKIWAMVALNPDDALLVSDLLSYFHAASVIPRLEKLGK